MARTQANIKKRHYRVLHRSPASFSVPASAAEFATFLGTFTELGYCRDKTIKVTINKGDQETLDDGTKLLQGYNCKTEGILLQSEPGDYTAYETIENVKQDILLYAQSTKQCIFFPNALLAFEEAVTSGETESVPFSFEAENVGSKSDFRTRFAESTA